MAVGPLATEHHADMNTSDVTEALNRKYGQKSTSSREREKWVVVIEARSGAGFDGNNGQCDYLAINTWKSQGLSLIGHEIKVSMADWRRELAEPAKSEMFARFCRRWWVVMPSKLAVEAKPEIPPTWGLMSVSEQGRITETVKAPAREPNPVPVWWWIGWLAQLDRRDKRAITAEVDRRLREEAKANSERLEGLVEQRVQRRLDEIEDLTETVNAFRDATGIDLRRVWRPHIDRLAKVWPLATQGSELDVVTQRMREVADMLDALSNDGHAR